MMQRFMSKLHMYSIVYVRAPSERKWDTEKKNNKTKDKLPLITAVG